MATPFDGEVFTFTQPDGTPLQVRGWGNQHSAVFETLDGYTVVRDPESGYFRYAEVSEDGARLQPGATTAGASPPVGMPRGLRAQRAAGERVRNTRGPGERLSRWEERRLQRRQQIRSARASGIATAPPPQQTVGDFVGLCMLIEFPDVPGTISRDEVDAFCNQSGYSGFGNNGSVFDYFFDVSNGNVNYTNIVVPWYTAAHDRSYYTDESIPQGVRARELIREGLTHLQQNGFDFSQLSADSQGYIYATNVYYAGTRVNNWAKGLWPHQWHLGTEMIVGPGRRAFDYQVTDMTPELTLGTFCHENGHMVCDFPDLYDYDGDSQGIGRYCLMCAGGADKRNPAHVGAYLKYKAGWAGSVSPVQPGRTEQVSASGDAFFVHSKSQDEYFILENRTATGRDASLPAEGLAIWHVDEEGNNSHQQGTVGMHFECALEQADGRFDLEQNRNIGDSLDLFSSATGSAFGDTTVPSSHWWDGSSSGLEITNVGAPGESISFTTAGDGTVVVGTISGDASPNAQIPDASFQGVTSTIAISQAANVGSVAVEVDIQHTYRGDLRVALLSPSGTQVILHDRAGGRKDDLKTTYDVSTTPGLQLLAGEPVEGPWSLVVHDLARLDQGTLKSWGLRIEPGAATSVRLEESPGVAIPDDDATGIERALTATGAGSVGSLTVDVDITHTYIRDLIVTLISPAGNRVDLHYRQGGSADNIIGVFDEATTPSLASLAGEPVGGDWRLRVSDREGADRGKLNSWGVTIQPD